MLAMDTGLFSKLGAIHSTNVTFATTQELSIHSISLEIVGMVTILEFGYKIA